MTSKRVDIFKLLTALSKKNQKFYEELTEEEKRTVAPLVVMRWLSGTQSARQVYFLNELVNPFVFSLYKHPELLMKLMTICTSGKFVKYKWNKPLSKKTTSSPITTKCIREYFGYNTIDALGVLPLLTNDDVLQYAEQLGYQPDEIKKIKAELKKR